MLKAYLPTAAELTRFGFDPAQCSSPFGTNFDFVADVKKADVVLMQPALRPMHLNRQKLKMFADYLAVDRRRIVAYDCSDDEENYAPDIIEPLFIRCSAKGWYVRNMPRTVSWPWPVEDCVACTPIPSGGFKYKVGFQGWEWSNIRVNAIASVRKEFEAHELDIATYKDFFGYLGRDGKLEEEARRKSEFRRSMYESLLSLCPASIHNVFPYRFFEAMSAARVPILFCTDYVLPMQDKIDYDKCTVIFSEEDSANAGLLIKGFLSVTSEQRIIEMGQYGRVMWDRWLNRDHWNDLFPEIIEEAMRRDGLL